MPTLHFLNVGQGDCTWIKHGDGKNTVIDVCNGRAVITKSALADYLRELTEQEALKKGLRGNFGQKEYPVNPIAYLKSFGETSIFRFVLTHPDMDHMDGLSDVFREFSPVNFWDTNNRKEMEGFEESRYSVDDWEFYKSLRDGPQSSNPKRLTLFSGSKGAYYNANEDGTGAGNGLYLLAPTPELVASANKCGDYNDCSYVILYRVDGKRIVIGGDSHDASWEHILSTHKDEVANVDLLIAPHHGRDSDRSYEFLEILQPKLTLFGIARSEHLGYDAWNSRGLEVMTNNQGNCFVVDFTQGRADVHCTNRNFANAYRQEHFGKDSFWDESLKSWYIKSV